MELKQIALRHASTAKELIVAVWRSPFVMHRVHRKEVPLKPYFPFPTERTVSDYTSRKKSRSRESRRSCLRPMSRIVLRTAVLFRREAARFLLTYFYESIALPFLPRFFYSQVTLLKTILGYFKRRGSHKRVLLASFLLPKAIAFHSGPEQKTRGIATQRLRGESEMSPAKGERSSRLSFGFSEKIRATYTRKTVSLYKLLL